MGLLKYFCPVDWSDGFESFPVRLCYLKETLFYGIGEKCVKHSWADAVYLREPY